jgi:methyltransferase (TIGR00027 family)
MKETRPSLTAAWVAAARTFGNLLPDELHIADDPYGAAFANTRLHERLGRSRIGRQLALTPGLGTWIMYMQVRTRVLDDIARGFAKRANAQVVLLGAGYDCRALRLGALANVPVFEVDHPATQTRKQRVLDRLGAKSPAHYVTWNFEQRPLDELPDALADAGLDRTRPVLTIWEGVTMYLSQGAIDASLKAIRAFGPGQLAMTYFERTRIETPSPMMRLVRASVRGIGEPFIWGWNRDEVPPYLAARGFRVIENRSLDDAALDFLPKRAASLVHGRNSCYALADVI